MKKKNMYHPDDTLKLLLLPNFLKTKTLKKKNVFEKINTDAHKVISDSCIMLKSIVQTLIFCGIFYYVVFRLEVKNPILETFKTY